MDDTHLTRQAADAVEQALAFAPEDPLLAQCAALLQQRLERLQTEHEAAQKELLPDPILIWESGSRKVELCPPGRMRPYYNVTVKGPALWFVAAVAELVPGIRRALRSRHLPADIRPVDEPGGEPALAWQDDSGVGIRVYDSGEITVSDQEGSQTFAFDGLCRIWVERIWMSTFQWRIGRLGFAWNDTLRLRSWKRLLWRFHWRLDD